LLGGRTTAPCIPAPIGAHTQNNQGLLEWASQLASL
jgi:hypothetical protein